MFALNAENRNTSLKPKQLRREGIIPGVLYGKNLEESLSLQVSQSEAARFLKTNSTGSKVELVLGDKKYTALLREASYESVSDKLEHLSFQTLLAGEVVTSTARIVLLNRELVTGMVQQQLNEVSFKALPKDLIDKIEIDLDGMRIGASMRVADLDIAKNPDIEVLSLPDDLVFSITDTQKPMETAETEEEVTMAEGE